MLVMERDTRFGVIGAVGGGGREIQMSSGNWASQSFRDLKGVDFFDNCGSISIRARFSGSRSQNFSG